MTGSHELHDQCLITARRMRKNQTQAEEMLWAALRGRKLAGLKFHRQHVMGPLIVDFYCAMAKLVVEVDGDIHIQQTEYDELRTNHLEDYGYRVIRFRNEMVLSDIESVLSEIKEVALGRILDLTPQPPPLIPWEGETDLTPNPSPNIAHKDRSRCFGTENVPRSGRGEKAHGADFSPDSERG